MLSNARIYIFNISYMNSTWLSLSQSNQLAGNIAQLLTNGIKDFTFKQLNFINVYESKLDTFKYSSQLHIEKIIYKYNKILPREYIAELRNKVKGQLNKVSMLKFGDILVVNDEFDFRSTSGFSN